MSLPEDIRASIEATLGTTIVGATRVRGGDINEAARLTMADGSEAFLKTHPNPPPGMFASEARGLQALARGDLRVPAVLASGEGFLLMTDLGAGSPHASHDEELGRGLAALHSLRTEMAGTWDGDNKGFIATITLNNARDKSWPHFYEHQRLRPLLRHAALAGTVNDRFEALFARLPELLCDAPLALLHGDLWRGNVHCDKGGAPCLVDPSVYAGDPEVDLAMMHLFGGFGSRVFAAYDEALPPREGRKARRALYQLYPVLVHVVLFGESYLPQLRSLLDLYA